MSVLTEGAVIARTRAPDLLSVRKLNCWGSELGDVSIIRQLKNVEVLSLSVNNIKSLSDFQFCYNLQELYVRKNQISNLGDIHYLRQLPKLKNLWLENNPCAETDGYRLTVLKYLPNLQKLDNVVVRPEEVQEAELYGQEVAHPQESMGSADEEEEEDPPPPPPPPPQHHSPPAEMLKSRSRSGANSDIPSPSNVTHRNSLYDDHSPSPPPREYETRRGSLASRNVNTNIMSPSDAVTNAGGDDVHARFTKHLQSPGSEVGTPTGERRYHEQQQGYYQGEYHQEAAHHDAMNGGHYAGHGVHPHPQQALQQQVYGGAGYHRVAHPNMDGYPDPATDEYEYRAAISRASDDVYRYPVGLMAAPQSHLIHPMAGMAVHPNGIPQHPHIQHKRALHPQPNPSVMEKLLESPSKPYPVRPKNRNSNILSAVLCLIKELDYASLEVVEMAVRCRMEELED